MLLCRVSSGCAAKFLFAVPSFLALCWVQCVCLYRAALFAFSGSGSICTFLCSSLLSYLVFSSLEFACSSWLDLAVYVSCSHMQFIVLPLVFYCLFTYFLALSYSSSCVLLFANVFLFFITLPISPTDWLFDPFCTLPVTLWVDLFLSLYPSVMLSSVLQSVVPLWLAAGSRLQPWRDCISPSGFTESGARWDVVAASSQEHYIAIDDDITMMVSDSSSHPLDHRFPSVPLFLVIVFCWLCFSLFQFLVFTQSLSFWSCSCPSW